MAEQQKQEQEQGRHSAVDRVNSTINRARSAAKWAKRAKKTAQAARVIVGLFSTGIGEILLIVLLFIFAAVAFIIIVSVVFGGGSNSNMVCTTKTVTTAGTGGSFSGNIDDYFYIYGGTSEQRGWVKDYLKDPLAWPKYATSLRTKTQGKLKIWISQNETCLGRGWACAYASRSYDIELTKSWVSARPPTRKHYLIHETGHIIGYRKLSWVSSFYDTGTRDGSKCYTSLGLLRTFPFNDPDARPNHESFAEAVADTVRCQVGEVCPGGYDDIRDFPTTCDKTYGWMTDNVLGQKGGSTTQTVTTCVAAPPPESAPQNTYCPSLTGEAEFECLTKGQGRNINALGTTREQFIGNAIKNIGSRSWGNATNRTYLTKIYNTAVAEKVNPVMLLVIWGVEASWRINGTEFGVLARRGEGFDSQLTGSVNILDYWMGVFNKKQVNGQASVHGCSFTDMFAYAYEWYTPVCYQDGNDSARKNFRNFYKIIMGI